ncbi:CPBP family intramembrane metalloprotease [bacterium]|nr:CPBP family intramembrane metalloprotease [bacterium]
MPISTGSKNSRIGFSFRLLAYSFGFWATFFISLFLVMFPGQKLNWDKAVTQAIFGTTFIALFFLFTRGFARRFDNYGWEELGLISGKPWWLAFGFALGALTMLGQLLVEALLGWTQFTSRPISSETFVWYIYPGISLVGIAASGFCEELAFRGYLWRKFQDQQGRLPIVLFMTALFFAIIPHFNQLNLFFFIFAFLMGLLLGWFRYRTGNLWFGIGFHWAWNWSQGSLWGSKGYSLIYVQHSPPTHEWAGHNLAADDILQIIILSLLLLASLIFSKARCLASTHKR